LAILQNLLKSINILAFSDYNVVLCTFVKKSDNDSSNIKIGKWCIIGDVSVVIKDISDNTTVVENPTKAI
jgi:hypothetical protein